MYNVVSIIKEQAAFLDKTTSGVVKAKFGKIKAVGMAMTLAALSAASNLHRSERSEDCVLERGKPV